MLTTSTSASWHMAMTSRGTPNAPTKIRAPASMMRCTWTAMSPGMAVSRSTPHGLSVSRRMASISASMVAGSMVAAPSVPMPPAADTAAASWW